MYRVKEKDHPYCTSITMRIISDKWKTVILNGTLRKQMVDVTERSLSLQLKQLQEDGVVHRKVNTTKPPLKVEYSLTDFGKTLTLFCNQLSTGVSL